MREFCELLLPVENSRRECEGTLYFPLLRPCDAAAEGGLLALSLRRRRGRRRGERDRRRSSEASILRRTLLTRVAHGATSIRRSEIAPVHPLESSGDDTVQGTLFLTSAAKTCGPYLIVIIVRLRIVFASRHFPRLVSNSGNKWRKSRPRRKSRVEKPSRIESKIPKTDRRE